MIIHGFFLEHFNKGHDYKYIKSRISLVYYYQTATGDATRVHVLKSCPAKVIERYKKKLFIEYANQCMLLCFENCIYPVNYVGHTSSSNTIRDECTILDQNLTVIKLELCPAP